MTAEPTLAAWLRAAWDRHDREPEALSAELAARAATVPDDGDGAETVRLARHVMLAHRADAAGLEALLAALPTGRHPALAAQVERTRWALAALQGEPAPALPEAVAWGLMGEVAQAEVVRGALDGARHRLFGVEAAARAHPDEPARRAFAASANNLALALRSGPRSPAHDALMLDVAALARRAWACAGTWLHVERADYQLARCHAVAGRGREAVAFAEACLAACEANDADAVERFFAHEALAHARRAAGDGAQAARHRERMQDLLAQVDDADMRAFCVSTLAALPTA